MQCSVVQCSAVIALSLVIMIKIRFFFVNLQLNSTALIIYHLQSSIIYIFSLCSFLKKHWRAWTYPRITEDGKDRQTHRHMDISFFYSPLGTVSYEFHYNNPKLDTRISFVCSSFVLLRHAQGTPPGF